MRPGEIRDRLDVDRSAPVVVLSSEIFNTAMARVIVAPLLATDKVAPGVATRGGYIGFSLLFAVPQSALSEPHGQVDDSALDEVHGYIAGAMTR